ncbi:MAG: flavodoxin-dependent (E)-4-hydroxy-3-methylbut-2-enyl-diphosphate synthase [Clostridia bacterium]|nr:flavodoxin-dependent (E)-4-hydroxy-3-methylbut-2-enyl-diphosphate synthase [Clostridia bacterium]
MRKKSRVVYVGGIAVGGGNRIPIQSMTNTDTHDIKATVEQITALHNAGCDIVRFTVPDTEAAEAVKEIRRACDFIPLVADIHFDYRLALKCAENGIDKIRINPGNIGGEDRVAEVARVCKSRRIPIRIGVNGGSLEKELLAKYGAPTPEALFESAMGHVGLLEKFGFDDIVISVKSSSVSGTVAANRYLAENCDFPLHIGVTEAGNARYGLIKNAEALGALIPDGIGDTVRVSLTADPVEEVYAGRDILRSLDCVGHSGMNIVSCPTCGRTRIDLIGLSSAFEAAAKKEGLFDVPVKVAIMGCVVNGPGEAHEADVGVAGGKGEALLFAHGEIVRKIPESEIVPSLINYIKDNYTDK